MIEGYLDAGLNGIFVGHVLCARPRSMPWGTGETTMTSGCLEKTDQKQEEACLPGEAQTRIRSRKRVLQGLWQWPRRGTVTSARGHVRPKTATVSVGDNRHLTCWPRSSAPVRATDPGRSGLQEPPAVGVLGSVTGCQDQMQPNIFTNRFIFITIFITILQMRKLRSAVESTTSKTSLFEDFPGVPVAKIPCSQCRGPGFYPWSGN